MKKELKKQRKTMKLTEQTKSQIELTCSGLRFLFYDKSFPSLITENEGKEMISVLLLLESILEAQEKNVLALRKAEALIQEEQEEKK